jgi:hypothetical protein
MQVSQAETSVPGFERHTLKCFGVLTDCAPIGIQPPQAAGGQLAGRRDPPRAATQQAPDEARCGPERLGESVRDAPQQANAPQPGIGSSEDLDLGGSGRKAPPQRGRPQGTGIGRKPPRTCRPHPGSRSNLRPLGVAPSAQEARRVPERLGACGCQGSRAAEWGLAGAVTRESFPDIQGGASSSVYWGCGHLADCGARKQRVHLDDRAPLEGAGLCLAA